MSYVSRKKIEDQLQSIAEQRAAALATLQALAGAEQLCRSWLDDLERIEAEEAKAAEEFKRLAAEPPTNGAATPAHAEEGKSPIHEEQ